VIGRALVPIVEEHNVPDIKHLVGSVCEELLEVLSRLCDLRQPDHRWQVGLATLQKLALQFDSGGVLCNNSLCGEQLVGKYVEVGIRTYWRSCGSAGRSWRTTTSEESSAAAFSAVSILLTLLIL